MWRENRELVFWNHDVWLIPIHTEETHHWTLAAVYWKLRSITFFDSFASKQEYEQQTLVSLKLHVHGRGVLRR